MRERAAEHGDTVMMDFTDAGPYHKSNTLVLQDDCTNYFAATCHDDQTTESVVEALSFYQGAKKITSLFFDNAPEFIAASKHMNILRNTSTKYRSESNGRAERAVQRVLTLARCLLYQSGLPLFF